MSTNRARLDALVSQCRHVLIRAAEQLASQDSWDFSCPCVVLDARDPEVKAAVIGIGSVGNLVPTSAAIDSPEVREWLRIASEKSPEVAFTEMLNGDQQRAERFTQAYDRLREERQSGVKGLWSADDLSSFVSKSRTAFPRALAAVALFPGTRGRSHSILTFENDVSSLLH